MSAQHTPGPWTFSRWDQSGDARFYVAQAEGAPYTPDYSDVATLVAETCSGERVAIQEANAHLIAAAPDLLAACQAQHHAIDVLMARLIALDPDFIPTKSAMWPALVAGSDAILKATGGAQ